MTVARERAAPAAALDLYGCPAEAVRLGAGSVTGYIAARAGRPGAVVAAPHGTSDPLTGEMAVELARRTHFGVVVAVGFALEPERPDGPGRRYQVNRPLEGVPGTPPAAEVETEGARRVYEAYERRVREVAQGPLGFYVEIHGNGRREAADRIEIATVGVDRERARRLRAALEGIRDAHLAARPEAARLAALVEPADPVRYAASGAKRSGILRLPAVALHIELPRAARRDARDLYTAILAEFLVEAAGLD